MDIAKIGLKYLVYRVNAAGPTLAAAFADQADAEKYAAEKGAASGSVTYYVKAAADVIGGDDDVKEE